MECEKQSDYFDEVENADYCLRVSGDSMTGVGIEDGDIVFIREKTTINSGDIVAIEIEDMVFLRTVHYLGDYIDLIPENPNYVPILIDKQNNKIRIIGKAVALRKNSIKQTF